MRRRRRCRGRGETVRQAASSRPSPATYLIIFTLNTKVCRQPSLFFFLFLQTMQPPLPRDTPTPHLPHLPSLHLLPHQSAAENGPHSAHSFKLGGRVSVQLTGCGKLEIKGFHLPPPPPTTFSPPSFSRALYHWGDRGVSLSLSPHFMLRCKQ